MRKPKLAKWTIRLPMGAAFQNRFDNGVNVVQRSVIPLLGSRMGAPYIVGSAVLIRLGARHLLVTAAHVFDENEVTPLYFFGLDGVATQLAATFMVERTFDVAICELSDQQIAGLSHNQFLERHDFRIATPSGRRSYAAVVGYPDTKTRVIPGTTLVDTRMYSMANLVQREDGSRIFVAFDKKRITDVETRRHFTAPDPYGMSGGAIFSMPISAMGNAPVGLAGIATHWRRSRRVFEGVVIERVMKLVRDGFFPGNTFDLNGGPPR